MLSLFCEVIGKGCEGDELIVPGSWQFVDSDVRVCWRMVHVSHFHWLSRVEAFGPVPHFWWNRFIHTLHINWTVLERRAAEHLANTSLELLASARDRPWFKRDFNDGGEMSGWVDGCALADDEECRWQCQTRVDRTQAVMVLLGFINPLHVAERWQTLSQDEFTQW